MSTGTFERQAVLFTDLHRAARELSELAGDSIAITIQTRDKHEAQQRRLAEADQLEERVAELEQLLAGRNETSPGTPTPGARGPTPAARQQTGPAQPGEGTAAAAALEVLRADGGWLATREVFARIHGDYKYGAVGTALKNLRERGVLEHNGEARRLARYRLAAASADPDPLPGGASSNLSPRTRKSVERAEREAAEAARSNGKPNADDIEERVLESIRFEAGTISEVAIRTDIPRRDVGPAIERLRDRGVLVHCGERMPRRHKVYGAIDG